MCVWGAAAGENPYHHRENNGSRRCLDNPEQDEAGELDEGEEVDFAQWHVPQVDEIWLMFCRHPKKLQTIKELEGRRYTGSGGPWVGTSNPL